MSRDEGLSEVQLFALTCVKENWGTQFGGLLPLFAVTCVRGNLGTQCLKVKVFVSFKLYVGFGRHGTGTLFSLNYQNYPRCLHDVH